MLFCASVAWAAEPPLPEAKPLQGCPIMDAGLATPELPELPPSDPNDPRIEVLTGKAEVDLNSGAVFSDQIRIRRGDGVLSAPSARYDKAN